jgi:predicted acyltransferase
MADAPILQPPIRLNSVDFLRGATVLAMLFVNDLAGVRQTPWWARHMPSTTDGMTFVDLVFPCFLFVVGLSIPLALGRRMDQGEPLLQTLRTILVRTASLVFVGVVIVNMGQHSGHIISTPLYMSLAYLAIIIAWHSPGSGVSATVQHITRIARLGAIILLAGLLAIFRAEASDGSLVWMRTQWWGILGLIGWAYLVVALWWRAFPRDDAAMAGLLGFLTCLGLAKRGADSFFTQTPILSTINSWIEVGGQIGGHGGIVAAGAILGMALRAGAPRRQFLLKSLAWGVGLVLAGFCLRPYANGFSKDFATPAWCLLCAGLSAILLALVHALLTPREPGKPPLLSPEAPIVQQIITVGQWALVPYLLAPLTYALFTLTGLENYYAAPAIATWPVGILRSVAFTATMTLASVGLIRIGLRLRL